MAALPDEAVLHLRGRNIPEFLQGQLTCDLRRLTDQRAVRGALCSVKGRVISDLWVVPVDGEHLLLRLRRSLAAEFAGHLERYARFSRISVKADEGLPSTLGLFGPGTSALCGEAPGACRQHGARVLLRSGRQQWQLIAADDAPLSDGDLHHWCGEAALAPAEAASAEGWYAEELAGGHYAIEAADRERYTPQALNYDELGLVAFDKGCYTGQEVVARLHYKGRSKHRLQIYRAAGDADIDIGEDLRREGAAIGEVLRRARCTDGSLRLAAMVAADARGAGAETARGVALTPDTAMPASAAADG